MFESDRPFSLIRIGNGFLRKKLKERLLDTFDISFVQSNSDQCGSETFGDGIDQVGAGAAIKRSSGAYGLWACLGAGLGTYPAASVLITPNGGTAS